MKISVIIPTFNRKVFICEAIKSVLNQTYKDIEIIVIDDGSTDNTYKEIKEMGDEKIRYYKFPHTGIPAILRNYGIKKARGEYIAFLDSDDLWLENKLKKQIDFYNKKYECLLFTDAFYMDSYEKLIKFNGKSTFFEGNPPPNINVYQNLIKVDFIPTLAVLVPKEFIIRVGYFDESPSLKSVEDYDLWLRISQKYKVDYINEPLAIYRVHNMNISLGENYINHIIAHCELYKKFLNSENSREIKKSMEEQLIKFTKKTFNYFLYTKEYKKSIHFLKEYLKYSKRVDKFFFYFIKLTGNLIKI